MGWQRSAGDLWRAVIIRTDPHARIRSWSHILDDPLTTPPPGAPGGPRKPPPGLRAQLGVTRDAAIALVMAHIELAKAEAMAIAGEVGRVAALGAIAVVVVILAALLLVIGASLFFGEWLLGSMGWGVLHGILLFVSIALACVLLALGISGQRVVRVLAVAIVVAILSGLVLGYDLLNRLYAEIGDRTALAVDPGIRPLVVGMLVGALVGLLVGIFAAASMDARAGRRFVALAGSIVAGVAIGAFTAITFSLQVGIAIGITLGYVTFIALLAMDVARTGIDMEALKARFYPSTTIDTSKETLEWLQTRMPPGTGS